MDRIGVRELRQNASKYLARVSGGETLEVTDRGRPVARLVPVPVVRDRWQELVDAGVITPAQEPGGLLDIEPKPYDGPPMSDVLDALRADRE